MPDCSNCRHYRREAWVYESILEETGTHLMAIEAIRFVREAEERNFEQESHLKIEGLGSDEDAWPTTPKISPYCGLENEEGDNFIAEVKNAGNRCEAFERDQLKGGMCADCQFAVIVDGWRSNAQALGYAAMINRADLALSLATSSVAFEIQGAHAADGVITTKPKYLTYCRKLSLEGRYVVCSIFNPKGACPHWVRRRPPIRGSFDDP
jgi:hypothetical protein